MSDKRVVLVNVDSRETSEETLQLQLDLSKLAEFSSDRERILDAIVNHRIRPLQVDEEIQLLLETNEFPGALVQFPSSPLKHLTVVRARVKRKPVQPYRNSSSHNNETDPPAILSNSLTEMVVNSLTILQDNTFNDEVNISYTGDSLCSNSGDTKQSDPKKNLTRTLTTGVSLLNNASDGGKCAPCQSFELSIAGMSVDNSASGSNLEERVHSGPSQIHGETLKTAEPSINIDAADQSSSGPPAKKIRTSVRDRNLLLSKLSWRTFFSSTINSKLENFLELTATEENAICRSLCDEIVQHTDCPDPPSVRSFVDKMFCVYPGLAGTTEDGTREHSVEKIDALKELWFKRFSKRLSRLRSENGTQLACGRPRKSSKEKAAEMSGQGNASITQVRTIDWVSYKENVAKMLSFFADAPSHPSLEYLYSITYEGRRAKLTLGDFDGSASTFIEQECPLLANKTYLLREFDCILRGVSAASNRLKEKWKQLTPKIIKYAITQERSCKNIQTLLRQRALLRDETVALQLLPLLLPGKARSLKGVQFFIQIIEESENMSHAAEKLTRLSPFLMKCGGTFHIVVDNKPVIHLADDADEAIIRIQPFRTGD